MPRGGAKKGERRGGRKKGTPNHTTTDARKAMELAFCGIGGVPSLIAWAQEQPDKFYALWGRMIPQQQVHSGDPEKPIQHAIVKWGNVEIPI